jgi:hypothetical protein
VNNNLNGFAIFFESFGAKKITLLARIAKIVHSDTFPGALAARCHKEIRIHAPDLESAVSMPRNEKLVRDQKR